MSWDSCFQNITRMALPSLPIISQLGRKTERFPPAGVSLVSYPKQRRGKRENHLAFICK